MTQQTIVHLDFLTDRLDSMSPTVKVADPARARRDAHRDAVRFWHAINEFRAHTPAGTTVEVGFDPSGFIGHSTRRFESRQELETMLYNDYIGKPMSGITDPHEYKLHESVTTANGSQLISFQEGAVRVRPTSMARITNALTEAANTSQNIFNKTPAPYDVRVDIASIEVPRVLNNLLGGSAIRHS